MFEEGSAPMATNGSGVEAVPLGSEVGGDEQKDIQWHAVDRSEGILPSANVRQSGRSVSVELGNGLQSEAAGAISMSVFGESRVARHYAQRRICYTP